MFRTLKNWLDKNEWATISLLVLLFVLVRLPGVHTPLHQDEYKWPRIVDPNHTVENIIPHPPLSEFIYRSGGYIVGFDVNLRFVPLFFGAVNLVLLYYLVRMLFGRREALVASFIWVFSYFSVLASLMVDTDGQIMPFFFLLALIFYYKLINTVGNQRYTWAGLLAVSCILGFLVKVSFLLAIGAIIADFFWSKRNLITKKDIIKYSSFFVLGVLGLIVLLFAVKFVFPFFNLSQSIEYWKHFLVGDRGWFQTIIQSIKAVLFASPFLVLIPFLGTKKDFSKIPVFIFFLIFSFLFYIVIFDFSIGALDKYLQLLVLPLTIITSVIITPIIFSKEGRRKEFIFLGTVVALIFVILQSIPHSVPPLHPKTEWIARILSLKWNFLYPFSGGSGPLPFYVSFLFMGLVWATSFFVIIWAKIKNNYKKFSILFLLPIGLAYNFVFIEEYMFGLWNGSAKYLIKEVSLFIKDNPQISKVTTYNDNGGDELLRVDKYRKRLYIDPKFDVNEKVKTLNQYKEHYLVINIPRIDQSSVYQRYFNSCNIIFDKNSGKISAIVYDCRNAPDIKI